jgi:hypothetical protein
MTLPSRAFFSLNEFCDRLDCSHADVAAWSIGGLFSIFTGISPVLCGLQPVAGMVAVNAADMMKMFRRHGHCDDECRVIRIRPECSTEWLHISEPAGGVVIKLADLLLMADDMRKFDDDPDRRRRPAPSSGAASRYDWEGAIIMLFCRFNDRGIPATQVELIAEVQDWFAQNSPTGEIPEESTTRKKIAPIWRALRETA